MPQLISAPEGPQLVEAGGRETLAETMRRLYSLSHEERHRLCRMVTHVTYRPTRGTRPRLIGRWRRYGAPPAKRKR